MTCAAAAEFLPDKLSGIVYGMCLDTQGATPNPEKVYVAGSVPAQAWFRNGDWLRTE